MPSNLSSISPSKDLLKGLLLGVSISTTTLLFLHKRKKHQSTKSENARSISALKKTNSNNNEINRNDTKTKKTIPSSMRTELISRTALYFPETIESHITQSSVLVLGCGGVGSHAAISLARSGVKYLRLVDMDMVTLSSLNRHACATLKDVGIPKVEAVKRTIDETCGGEMYCKVDARCEMYTGDRNHLLDMDEEGQKWDFVVDAIDDISTKTALLAECFRRNIRVVTCMGAGGKSDPTRLHIGDLNSVSRDPLAAKLRMRLKKIDPTISSSDSITAVFSSEKVVMKLADFTEEQKEQGVQNFGAIDGMRVRVLPVLGSMPAIMGQACAAYALCEIGKKSFSPNSGEKLSRSVRHRAFQHFGNRENHIRKQFEQNENNDANSSDSKETKQSKTEKAAKPNHSNCHLCEIDKFENLWTGPLEIDMDDIDFIMSDQWRQKCAITSARLGTILELVRWDMSKPSTIDNLVLMGIKSIRVFDECGWDRDVFGKEIREKVEKRLCRAKDTDEW